MSLDHPLGQRIRSAREARGWSQQDLAAAVGVTSRTVGNWERGRSPKQHIGAIERELHVKLRGDEPSRSGAIADLDDAELVAELATRLAACRRRNRDLEAQLRVLANQSEGADV